MSLTHHCYLSTAHLTANILLCTEKTRFLQFEWGKSEKIPFSAKFSASEGCRMNICSINSQLSAKTYVLLPKTENGTNPLIKYRWKTNFIWLISMKWIINIGSLIQRLYILFKGYCQNNNKISLQTQFSFAIRKYLMIIPKNQKS